MPRSTRWIALLLGTMACCVWGASPDLAQLTQDGAATRGLVVQVGAADASLAIALAKAHPVVVLLIVPDAAAETAIRKSLVDAGVHGQVTAACPGPKGELPLTNETAAVVVADLAALPAIPQAELLRVARPLGRLYQRQGTEWVWTTKPRPAGHGDWGQYHADAAMSDVGTDRVAGPAYGIQWASGPQEASKQGVRVVGGLLVQPEGKGELVARDASSGLPVWVRPDIRSLSRYSLLLDDQRVYLYPISREGGLGECMIALDARTGKTVLNYTEGISFKLPLPLPTDRNQLQTVTRALQARAADFQARLPGDGSLVQAADRDLVVLSATDGKKRWAQSAADGTVFLHPVVADGAVFVFEGRRAPSYSYTHWPNVATDKLRAFNLADGKERWTFTWPADRPPAAAYNLVFSNGKLAAVVRDPWEGKGQVRALIVDARTGREDYFASNDVFKGEIGGGHSSARAIALGDRLWLTTIISVNGSMSLAKPGDAASLDKSYARLTRPVGCTAYRATSEWIFGSLTTYAPDGKLVRHTDAARTACDVGAFPASGLSYITPNGCFCQPYLPGMMAFHPRKFAGAEDTPRLERGPGTAAPAAAGAAGDWPMFLRDNRRSAWASQNLAGELKPLWKRAPGATEVGPAAPLLAAAWGDHWYAHGPLTQASVAEGVVVAGLAHRQEVLAMDPATGRELWRVAVDGRVDSAPTIFGGLVLAGTRNGWIYALQRDTGALVWRFLAAPRHDRIVVDGELESPWPLFGTVNADAKGIYAMAGRHTDADGGLFWYRLSPKGDVLAQGRIGEDELKSSTSGGSNPRSARATGANTPGVMTDQRLLLAGVHLERSATGDVKPWFGLMETGRNWEWEFWALRHNAGLLVPGNQGILARVGFLNGYKLPAYAYTQARLYAYQGDDFVMVGGAPSKQHRGGQGGSTLRRMKKTPELVTTEKPNPKEPAKPIRSETGADIVWDLGEDLPRGDGLTAVAVAGDTVLVGLEVTNRDRYRQRTEMPYRLQFVNFADGKVRQELALPAPPVIGGIAVAQGRVYVTTSDGTLSCFAAP